MSIHNNELIDHNSNDSDLFNTLTIIMFFIVILMILLECCGAFCSITTTKNTIETSKPSVMV